MKGINKNMEANSMPFLVFRRDHLRSNLGIIFGLGIICGRGSFAVQFGDHFRSGDHLRSNLGIIFGLGTICGRGSFAVQFGDHIRSGDHFRSGIICGAVQTTPSHCTLLIVCIGSANQVTAFALVFKQNSINYRE